MAKDMKEGLTSNRKADTTHVRLGFQRYTARPCEYGSIKYERANYLRNTGDEPHAIPTGADFERFRKYLRAARDHINEVLDQMEHHQAHDYHLQDVVGMCRAAYAIDLDVTPGSKYPPSRLPHIAPACASLMMAIEQAIACGLLPHDPGTPWERDEVPHWLSDRPIFEPAQFDRLEPDPNAPFEIDISDGVPLEDDWVKDTEFQRTKGERITLETLRKKLESEVDSKVGPMGDFCSIDYPAGVKL